MTFHHHSQAGRTPPSSPGLPCSTRATRWSGRNVAALLLRTPWSDDRRAETPASWSGSPRAKRPSWNTNKDQTFRSALQRQHIITTQTAELWPLCSVRVAEISLNFIHALQVLPRVAVKHLPLVREVKVHEDAFIYAEHKQDAANSTTRYSQIKTPERENGQTHFSAALTSSFQCLTFTIKAFQ